MSTDPDHNGTRATLATGALFLLPALCCGLPLLVAGGALAGLGSVLGNPWVIGAAVALVAGVVMWRMRSRTGTARRSGGPDCCASELSAADQSHPTKPPPQCRKS